MELYGLVYVPKILIFVCLKKYGWHGRRKLKRQKNKKAASLRDAAAGSSGSD